MKVLRTLHNCKVNCLILQFGRGQETGSEDRGMGNTTHLPCASGKKILLQTSLSTLLCSTACHTKKTLTSSNIFSTACLVFHIAFLGIIFKNTATIWMPYPSFPAYQGFFPLHCSSNHSMLKNKPLKEVFSI